MTKFRCFWPEDDDFQLKNAENWSKYNQILMFLTRKFSFFAQNSNFLAQNFHFLPQNAHFLAQNSHFWLKILKFQQKNTLLSYSGAM